MNPFLEQQLAVFDRRAEAGDIYEMEFIAEDLRRAHGQNPALDAHVGDQMRQAYERRLAENLAALAAPAELDGFFVRFLADEIRHCGARLGRELPNQLRALEREAYRGAAERYLRAALIETSRQIQPRLKSFARYFAALAGPFCELEITAALGETM